MTTCNDCDCITVRSTRTRSHLCALVIDHACVSWWCFDVLVQCKGICICWMYGTDECVTQQFTNDHVSYFTLWSVNCFNANLTYQSHVGNVFSCWVSINLIHLNHRVRSGSALYVKFLRQLVIWCYRNITDFAKHDNTQINLWYNICICHQSQLTLKATGISTCFHSMQNTLSSTIHGSFSYLDMFQQMTVCRLRLYLILQQT